jgi:UDP:flavonoid glycosyltransferase YjiC (YdhE family)
VQECLATGVRQLVLPFSTDQFANAADLERVGVASVLAPNEMTITALAEAVMARLDAPLPVVQPAKTQADIIQLLFE